jgi:hypothetical protein
MSEARARGRAALAVLLMAAAVACAKKEEPPPPTTTLAAPSVAPVTTTPTTTLPSPPPVWGAAHWGMTKDEVLAAFPAQAQRLGQPADFGPPMPGSTDIAIAAYEMEGTKFRVLFGFEGEALSRIQLSAAKAGEATCGDVEKLLTDKHAAPADRATTQTTVRTDQIVWRLPDQTISLSCSEARGLGYRSVTLDYTRGKT